MAWSMAWLVAIALAVLLLCALVTLGVAVVQHRKEKQRLQDELLVAQLQGCSGAAEDRVVVGRPVDDAADGQLAHEGIAQGQPAEGNSKRSAESAHAHGPLPEVIATEAGEQLSPPWRADSVIDERNSVSTVGRAESMIGERCSVPLVGRADSVISSTSETPLTAARVDHRRSAMSEATTADVDESQIDRIDLVV
mmetsp:Transcript_11823/g.34044  ORF Transcript_11823/g.34044 Transcript_11823/m.34044 type:complete len:195 (+) Transcript_11823:2-586(+)